MRLGCGFLLVLLAPILEFFVWLGAGGIYKLTDLLGALAFLAGFPLFVGLVLILSWPDGSGYRAGAAALLITFVAPVGGLLAAMGNYSRLDLIVTEMATAALPLIVGIAMLVAVWTTRHRNLDDSAYDEQSENERL